jgi:hypothetical protein
MDRTIKTGSRYRPLQTIKFGTQYRLHDKKKGSGYRPLHMIRTGTKYKPQQMKEMGHITLQWGQQETTKNTIIAGITY